MEERGESLGVGTSSRAGATGRAAYRRDRKEEDREEGRANRWPLRLEGTKAPGGKQDEGELRARVRDGRAEKIIETAPQEKDVMGEIVD